MQQRDIIKDQIEQVGKVLGQLLSKFLDLKTMGEERQAVEVTKQELKDELDIDVEALLDFDKEALKDFVGNKNLAEKSLEILSDYLRKIGSTKEKSFPKEAIRYYQKAIEMLELADEVSGILSFDRLNLQKEIKAAMVNLQ